MKWVTRSHMHVNRTATAWLIRHFLDPSATFLFVEPDEVAAVQAREGAIGFDAPGATYPHRDEMSITPESAGLWAISQGFTDVARDDAETLDRASFLYDALYAHLRRTASTRSA